MISARQATLNTLLAVLIEKQSLAVVLPRQKKKLHERERSLYQQLTYSTLRHHVALSALRDWLSDNPLSANDPIVGIILNLGIEQLLNSQLATYAVVNETVNLAQKNDCARAKGLINAILRRALREEQQCREYYENALKNNIPEWLARHYRHESAQLAAIHSLPPPLTLRLHKDSDKEQYLADNPIAHANPLYDRAITLEKGVAVADIAGFASGIVSVQDASAQRAAPLLDVVGKQRVLDACAAPGGKTIHLRELAPESTIDALDSDAKRLQKVAENLQRCNYHANLLHGDASKLSTWYRGKRYDAILLDAPCSGSGVLRRHPDIAFLRTKNDLYNYPKVQYQLLTTLWQTLAPGGKMLYTTCSLLPQENQHLIEHFIAKTNNAQLVPLKLADCIDTGFGNLHLPDVNGDGFFYSLIAKN